MNDYHFFLRGPLSQWSPSKFSLNQQSFVCAEQYMMWAKAILFNDDETSQKIIMSNSPKVHKELGRTVKNFNQTVWDEYKEKIVFVGNLAKFRQNEHLKKYLLHTGDTVLVECNPYDSIWGIGLSESDSRIYYSSQWKGKNLLGKILTRVKLILRTEEEEIKLI